MQKDIESVDFSAAPFEHAINKAVLALARDGVVRLRSACDPALVDQWRSRFEQSILRQVSAGTFPYRIWSLGHKRTHYILEICKEFNTPDFYAIPAVYSLAKQLLDNDFFLVTAAIAHADPGALPQYIHRDQPPLFPGHKINEALPAVSLTVSIPLVDTDEETGGTEFQLGSHRSAGVEGQFAYVPTQKGDCLVWDSRLLHRGRGNMSDVSRPIILLYYQRPWFFNFKNYSQDAEIKITDPSLARVPATYRHLFDWVRKIWLPPAYERDKQGYCTCGSGLLYEDCHQTGD